MIKASKAGFRDGFNGAWYVAVYEVDGEFQAVAYPDGHTAKPLGEVVDTLDQAMAYFDAAVEKFESETVK